MKTSRYFGRHLDQNLTKSFCNKLLFLQKIDSKHEENKKRFEYIEDMVSIGEGEEGHGEQIIIRDALRWLKR